MKDEHIYKEKSTDSMMSDQIVLVDSNNNKLKFFWLVQEVIFEAKGNKSFKFSKADNAKLYNFLSKLGEQIKLVDKWGDFVKDNSFTWYHLSRRWDKPFEEEAGFVATLNNDFVEIDFFHSKDQIKHGVDSNNFFISMGAPDGLGEPYSSMSGLFCQVLNEGLSCIPYKKELGDGFVF